MVGDVVVPLDGSRDAARALGPAAALVRRTKGTLMAAAFTTDDDQFGVADAVRRQLDEFDYIKTNVLVEQATASIPDELAALVASNPGAIVCMTTAGRGRAAGIAGSVAKDLLRAIEVALHFELEGAMQHPPRTPPGRTHPGRHALAHSALIQGPQSPPVPG